MAAFPKFIGLLALASMCLGLVACGTAKGPLKQKLDVIDGKLDLLGGQLDSIKTKLSSRQKPRRPFSDRQNRSKHLKYSRAKYTPRGPPENAKEPERFSSESPIPQLADEVEQNPPLERYGEELYDRQGSPELYGETGRLDLYGSQQSEEQT